MNCLIELRTSHHTIPDGASHASVMRIVVNISLYSTSVTPPPSLQRLHGTLLLAAVAEDALRGVLPLAGVVVHLHVHRTDFQTFAAMNALTFVATDAQHGEVTHRLEEDRDGTDVLAEGAVVFEDHGERDADRVVEQVADKEQHE